MHPWQIGTWRGNHVYNFTTCMCNCAVYERVDVFHFVNWITLVTCCDDKLSVRRCCTCLRQHTNTSYSEERCLVCIDSRMSWITLLDQWLLFLQLSLLWFNLVVIGLRFLNTQISIYLWTTCFKYKDAVQKSWNKNDRYDKCVKQMLRR